MILTNKDGVRITREANRYNFHGLLVLLTDWADPHEIAGSLKQIYFSMVDHALNDPDFQGGGSEFSNNMHNLRLLWEAIDGMNTKGEEDFKLVFAPYSAE